MILGYREIPWRSQELSTAEVLSGMQTCLDAFDTTRLTISTDFEDIFDSADGKLAMNNQSFGNTEDDIFAQENDEFKGVSKEGGR